MNFDNVYCFASIDSTQKEAWRLYDSSLKNDIIVIANNQTDGIGTHGRVWHTGYGNVAFSFLVRVRTSSSKLDGFTYKIAEIIRQILKVDYKVDVQIKLPNDLMINDKKVGGILVETKLQKDVIKAIVVGVGINIKNAPIDFEAIAINDVYKVNINKEILIDKICTNIKSELIERIK